MQPRHDVYMSGALSGLNQEEYNRLTTQIYDRVDRVCGDLGLVCYCPHKSKSTPSKGMPHGKVWKMDYERVASAGAVVAYIGTPALGVGAEIEMARSANVPVILIFEASRQEGVSRLILGAPAVVAEHTVVFDNPEDIDEPIKKGLFDIFSRHNLDDAAEEEEWTHSDYKRLTKTLTDEIAGDRYRNRAPRPISKDEWKALWRDTRAKPNEK